MQPIIGFIPCRAGSERVKNKNTRPFASFNKGLLELKLLQMAKVPELDKVIVSSNDPNVLEFVKKFSKQESRFVALERPEKYGNSATSMEEFTNYIAKTQEEGILFWTHVTHPFLTSCYYNDIIAKYADIKKQGHDSLVTVTRIHKFIWSKDGPYNYSNLKEKWPRSQDLKPLFEINHGVYMLPFSVMRAAKDRIGFSPYLYDLPESVALDVDWEDQFILLNDIALARQGRNISLL
ncbi:MAG: hypothetical protein L3J33_10430 [Rhodobacteraceae bacterium]|nr:hypothetical protein [Paracoccaceae bacterium]